MLAICCWQATRREARVTALRKSISSTLPNYLGQHQDPESALRPQFSSCLRQAVIGRMWLLKAFAFAPTRQSLSSRPSVSPLAFSPIFPPANRRLLQIKSRPHHKPLNHFPGRPADKTGLRNNPAKHHQSPPIDFLTPFPAPIATPSSSSHSQSQPIQNPSLPVYQRDPNQLPTPLLGQGDRKGHLFPFARTSSPTISSPSSNNHLFSPEVASSRLRQERSRPPTSFQISPRSHHNFKMHGEQLAARYTPSSPLSPKLMSSHQPLSPQPQRTRANHSRQTSRTLHTNLPKYHPANFQHNESPGGVSSAQTPTMGLQRDPQGMQNESPRLMRERQRELIDRARMSSRIAASPMGIKPDAPRLDPLGSPKGPVTPLALAEGPDYFQHAVVATGSAASSPGARSDGSVKEMAEGKPKKFTKGIDSIR